MVSLAKRQAKKKIKVFDARDNNPIMMVNELLQ